ncbi:MAG: O-antigen ligase family protein [Caldilineaceae bacterium]|nr:O-antigen ligase family protein [Caldilineaceae bacterium]
MQRLFHRSSLRTSLALLRLICLLIITGFGGLAIVLMLRQAQAESPTLATPLPTLATTAPPFLGITVALQQDTPHERQQALARLREAGFGWVRQRIDWGAVEPQPGQYHWQPTDDLLADIIAASLVPVVVLDGSPAWARAPQDRGPHDNPLAPPADPATFAHFAATVAARYQTHLRFYQLWDEPNIAPHWGNRLIEPVAYVQLLKAASPAIRQADPDAVIITAALAPTRDRGHLAMDEPYFLQRLYAAGAAPYFDVVAAQPFGFGHGPADPRSQVNVLNFQRIKLIRQTMLAAQDGTTPIWIVRYGWNTRGDSPWRTVTPADQAAYASAALRYAHQTWPWVIAMGWAIDQPTQPVTDPLWGFALTDDLAHTFQQWQATASVRDRPSRPAATHLAGRWLLIGIGGLLVLWRLRAAASSLPWRRWQEYYRAWPPRSRLLLWLLLALLYYFTTWPPLLMVWWLLALFFISADPRSGLGGVALLLPFYFQHKEIAVAGYRTTLPPAHAMLFCLGAALWLRQDRSLTAWRWKTLWPWRHRLHPFDWLALLWLLISLLPGLYSWPRSAYAQGLLNLVLLPLLAYAATRYLARTPRQQTEVIGALFVGGVAVAMIGIRLWWQGQGTAADGVLRLVGPYFSPNHTALYLERTAWLGVGLAFHQSNRWRRWLFLAVGLIGVALFLTASRGAWLLGMPAGALTCGWLLSRYHRAEGGWYWWPLRRWHRVGLGLGTIAVLLMGVTFSYLSWERLTNSATITERLLIWQTTWQLWREHWLVGVGPGGFFWYYPRYLPWSATADPNLLHPHNLWLELLAGWGILGLSWVLCAGWQIGRIYARIQRHARHNGPQAIPWPLLGLLAALAAGLVHGQVDTFAALPDLAVWHWIALGLVVNTLEIRREA